MDKGKVYRAVQKQLSKGNIDKAINLWEEYVRTNPDGNIYNTIGDLYLRKGDKKKAVEYFHRAAEVFVKEGFSTKAQALYKKILHINPQDSKALMLIGDLYSEKGFLQEAAKFYLSSIEALAKEGLKEKVAEACQKIISLAPDNTSLRNRLAEYLKKEGFIEEASREYMFIGKTFLDRADDENATVFLEKAYELYPRNKEVYPLLINLYLSIGEKEKAERLLEQASELFPDELDLKVSRAEILKDNGRYDDAIEVLTEVLSSPSLPEETEIKALRLRAELYQNKGNTSEALDDLILSSEKLFHKERYQESEDLLLRAKEIEPEKALENLVEIYKLTGQNDKLVSSLVELADLKASVGENEMAMQLYNEASVLAPDDEEIKTKMQQVVSPETLTTEEPSAPEVKKPSEEKDLSEKFLDVDIYMRYGLTSEAIELLERLKVEEPQNIEIHKRLKNLYLEISDKEKAIAECLALAKIMEAKGDVQEQEKYINEALEIDPTDPRLAEFTGQRLETSPGTLTTEEFLGTSIQGLEAVESEEMGTTSEPAIQEEEPTVQSQETDYSEELSEAEFYFRQGLYEDALEIYTKLSQSLPHDETIKQRISEIQEAMATEAEGQSQEEVSGTEEDVSPGEDFQSLFSDEEIKTIIEEETTKGEPELEEDVSKIFEEFKKGISEEVSQEDYETHYNLGIAYKEMGLIDDAIKEFQIAKDSPEKKVHVLSMLGLCYMEKGLWPLAVETFEEALKNTTEKDETYWSIKFDLAESYEKMGDRDKALSLFTEIYGWNSKFRAVDEKINTLKGGSVEVVLEKETGEEKAEEKETKKSSKKDKISYI